MRSLALVALVEALATLSFTSTPRVSGKNSRFLGPCRLSLERAGTVGGGTVYGANFLGKGNANRQDLVGDGVATTYQTALAYVAFSNYNWLVKIDKSGRTGTVTTTAGSATVTGSSTDFDPELSIGDTIQIGEERRHVIAIASDTSLTVDVAFNVANSAVVCYLVDAVLRQTTDFTLSSVGGNALVTITAAAKAPANAKIEVHYIGTPTTLFTFATATTQFKELEVQGMEAVWYVSGATTSPSATNVYLEPIGQ